MRRDAFPPSRNGTNRSPCQLDKTVSLPLMAAPIKYYLIGVALVIHHLEENGNRSAPAFVFDLIAIFSERCKQRDVRIGIHQHKNSRSTTVAGHRSIPVGVQMCQFYLSRTPFSNITTTSKMLNTARLLYSVVYRRLIAGDAHGIVHGRRVGGISCSVLDHDSSTICVTQSFTTDCLLTINSTQLLTNGCRGNTQAICCAQSCQTCNTTLALRSRFPLPLPPVRSRRTVAKRCDVWLDTVSCVDDHGAIGACPRLHAVGVLHVLEEDLRGLSAGSREQVRVSS